MARRTCTAIALVLILCNLERCKGIGKSQKIVIPEDGTIAESLPPSIRNGAISLHLLEIEDVVKERSLPPNLFKEANITQLIIRNSRLDSLGESPFDGLLKETLETLAFINNVGSGMMCDWDWKKLSNLKTLKTLVISRSMLSHLPESFSEISGDDVHLERLFITACPMNVVLPSSLKTFNDIEEISLEACELDCIRRNMFPDSPSKLTRINLSSNGIRTIDSDSFQNMPNLKYVDLELNKLRMLSDKLSGAGLALSSIFDNLDYLGLYGNTTGADIFCFQGIEWLIKDNDKTDNVKYEQNYRKLICGVPLQGTLISSLSPHQNLTEDPRAPPYSSCDKQTVNHPCHRTPIRINEGYSNRLSYCKF